MTQSDTPEPYEMAEFLAWAWDRHRKDIFENTRNVSEWLVGQIDPQPGQTILELAAGPGETGFLVAERVGAGGRLISTDISAGMVDAARRGAEARGLGNVEFRVMDAQDIELPDASVDAVLSRFGVMLVPEPARAVHETRRVLRAGGRFAYAVWGLPDRNPWLTRLVGAVIERGHAPPGDPFGSGGVFSLADPDANRTLVGGAGFAHMHVEEVAGEMRFESFDRYWEIQSTIAGPIARLVQSVSADEVQAIKTALERTVAPFRSGDGYAFPNLAIGVSAR